MENTSNTTTAQAQTAAPEPKLYISQSMANSLPAMVRNELAKLSANKQEEFVEEYKRKRKSTGFAYLLWFIFALYYAYIGKWGLQFVFWFTAGGLGIWAIIDLFRMPGMIENYNKDIATDVMRNMKMMSA